MTDLKEGPHTITTAPAAGGRAALLLELFVQLQTLIRMREYEISMPLCVFQQKRAACCQLGLCDEKQKFCLMRSMLSIPEHIAANMNSIIMDKIVEMMQVQPSPSHKLVTQMPCKLNVRQMEPVVQATVVLYSEWFTPDVAYNGEKLVVRVAERNRIAGASATAATTTSTLSGQTTVLESVVDG